MATEGATKYSADGCGTLTLNNVAKSPLFGIYIGTVQDYSTTVSTVGGNSNVPAFTDSFSSFIELQVLKYKTDREYLP